MTITKIAHYQPNIIPSTELRPHYLFTAKPLITAWNGAALFADLEGVTLVGRTGDLLTHQLPLPSDPLLDL
jgi:hypothetical protein